MKKLINTAFGYAIASMAFGVFYREFTKWNGFTGKTTLAVNHLHLFAVYLDITQGRNKTYLCRIRRRDQS